MSPTIAPQWILANEVDEDGNPTRRERDTDGDGIVDEIYVAEYVQIGFAWEFDF